jgi:IS4 transposase
MGCSSPEIVAVRGSLVEEMAQGELGDARLNARRNRLVAVLEQHPDQGFPDACADDAEVEALYRFLRNRRVSLDALVAPHLRATRERCAGLGEVLVIHDTTDMVFSGEAARPGLTRLGQGRHGFWLHAGLAVSADGLRAPLGLVSLVPFVRKTRPRGTPKDAWARFADPEKESRCWADGVAAVRARFGTGIAAIHVMDRGADSYELLATMIAERDRFVVRLNHDRRVVTAEGPVPLATAMAQRAVICERTITIAPRRAGNRPQQSLKKHPPREGREATVQVAVQPLVLQRPGGRPYHHMPATLRVHVVAVSEVAVPPGQDPIDWRLITTEPIDTVEQVLQIVEWYRTRWLIEEYFKALKTGCAYEKRQLESLETLLVALALLAPIAWQLLLLRHLARTAPDTGATAVLSGRQVDVLRAVDGATLGGQPTLREALRAVARLGGHLKQNGPPGWLVLGRGMQKLLWMEAGWAAAEHARICDQS